MATTAGRFVVIDGGMGHMLKRLGVKIEGDVGTLQRFLGVATANKTQPELVIDAHRQYIQAGATVVTTNNYACIPNVLNLVEEDGGEEMDRALLGEYIRAAGSCARQAADGANAAVRVAGALPPLASSYRADLVPTDDVLLSDYEFIAKEIAPYSDVFLCETMSLIREGVGAATCASNIIESGNVKPKSVWVSFTVSDAADGKLRSGESIEDAAKAVASIKHVEAILINCSSPEAVNAALPRLRASVPESINVGAYANGFQIIDSEFQDGYREDLTPAAYAEYAQQWFQVGGSGSIVGGCCGVFPEHVAAISKDLESSESATSSDLECILQSHPGMTSPAEESCFEIRPMRLDDSYTSLDKGNIICETMFLSVDPYMRCMLDGPDHPQLGEYIDAFKLGDVISGGGVGRVIESKNPKYTAGDVVCAPFLGWPWATKARFNADTIAHINMHHAKTEQASLDLGYLGMPGLTSYFCMLARGRPQKSETVVISGAAGACGTLAGQLAKSRGARVIGICGSAHKGQFLQNQLGFDAAVNYRDDDFKEQLQNACPHGIDVYMDNVGGSVSDACLHLTNDKARVPICGQISEYNKGTDYLTLCSPLGLSPDLRKLMEERQVERGRFLVLDHQEEFSEALADLISMIEQKTVRVPETITYGFAPHKAFTDMMGGSNIGKALVDLENGKDFCGNAPEIKLRE